MFQHTDISASNKMKNKEYHAVRTKQRIPRCQNKTKNTTLSEQNTEYHAVGTVPTSNCKIVERGKIDNLNAHT
jgi:hypothetical protein